MGSINYNKIRATLENLPIGLYELQVPLQYELIPKPIVSWRTKREINAGCFVFSLDEKINNKYDFYKVIYNDQIIWLSDVVYGDLFLVLGV